MAAKSRSRTGGRSASSSKKSKLDVIPGTQWDEYLIPHLGVIAVFVVALLARAHLHQAYARVAVGTYTVIASLVLGWVVYRYAKARDPFQRAHAALTPVLGGAGIAVTLVIGSPLAWCWTYGLVGITIGLTWNVRNARVVKGEGNEPHAGDKGWDEIHGVPGSRAHVIEDTPDHRRIRVRLARGQNRDDLGRAARSIEAATGGQYGSVRQLPPPSGRADEGDLILMKRDVLKDPPYRPQWVGTRRSVADGLFPGLFESGDRICLRIAGGKEGPPANLQVMGISRAGKSHLFRLAVLDLAECDDVVLWVSDTIKGKQTIGPLMPAIDWFASTKAETFAMFAALDRVIRYRADWLGERKLDEWVPGCGLPLLIAWIEEAARVLGDSDRFTRLCESALSAGVVIVNSMQRASHDNMPTSARANISAAVCFAVRSEIDAGFVLPDDVMATAIPHLWGTDLENRQGYLYAVAPGVTPEQRAMPGRTYRFDHDGTVLDGKSFGPLIAARAGGMSALDEGTAAAAGQPYADRKAGRNRTSVPDQRGPAPVDETDEDMDELDDYADDDDDLVTPTPDPEDGRDMARIDPRADLPRPAGEIAFGLVGTPGPELSGPERHAAWLRVVDEVAARFKPEADGSVVVPLTTDNPDRDGGGLLEAWMSVPGVTPSTRPWVHARLAGWCEPLGDLAERVGRGQYRLTPELLRMIGNNTAPVTEGDEGGEFVRTAAGPPPPL